MTLGIDDVAAFLLERGLVDRRDIVRGDLQIVDASRRNRNLRVVRRQAPSYFLKQPDPGEPETHGTLTAEARYYELCETDPRVKPIRAFLPRRVAFVADRALLVLELVDGATPLREHYVSLGAGKFPVEIGALLGRALATLHRTFRDPVLSDDPRLQFLPESRPWVLRAHKPIPEMLERLSAANCQMLKILQEAEGIGRSLDELGKDWRVETLQHSDLRADNLLLVTSGAAPRLYIVDWELVQRGDPAWDVGAMLQDLLLFWIQSMPISAQSSPEQMLAEAKFPLSTIIPAFRGLWDTYRRETDLGGRDAAMFLWRAVRASAARMVQSAYEHCRQATALSDHAVLMLQVAANILADPATASLHLFGIPPT